MKGKTILMAGVAAVALVGASGSAFAAASPSSGDASYQALADRVAALEQALQDEQDRRSSDHTRLSTLEQNFNDTVWSFDNARPTVKSGDGRFTMAFRVRFQFDNANYFQKAAAALPPGSVKDLANGSVVRRAFFGVEGKAFNDFWYEFRYNGGGTDGGTNGVSEGDGMVSLARVAYLGIPNFRLNIGVIEPVFMYEGTTSSGQLMFLERPEIDNIAADSFGAGDARRGIELTFQKEAVFLPDDNLVISGAFTGSKTGTNAGHGAGKDEQTQALGRVSYRFWRDGVSNAMIGGSAGWILNTNTLGATITLQDRPEMRVNADRLISTGGITARSGSMFALDGGFNIENFYLGGEYAQFRLNRTAPVTTDPTFHGWYVEGSWVLTGEPKSYTVTSNNNEVGGFGAPRVANPFSLSGDSWGAWELTARYSDTNLNSHEHTAAALGGVAGGEERILDLGVNWYINQTVKLQVNDLIVNVNRLSAPAAVTKIGQNLNILGARLQFSN